MKKQQLLIILGGLFIVILSVVIGLAFLSPIFKNRDNEGPGVVAELPQVNPDEQEEQPEEQKPKDFIQVVFIGKNSGGDEVYKVVKREYDANIDGSKLRFAISSLIMGPIQTEKATGIYSEVPTSTNILHVYDNEDKVIVDLSSGFVYGGGTESVYKRLFQLIKTITRNTEKPAYLYIDGRQADVIGGDGIMITQPLSENSIGE
jgi:spore germination protein GerM